MRSKTIKTGASKNGTAKGEPTKSGALVGATGSNSAVPRHVALIMDGNGRWAKARLMPRQMGHREGLKTIEQVTRAAKKQGIEYLSFFAFSTENWRRPKQEVDSLMNLLKTQLPKVAKKMKEQGISLVFSGDLSGFDGELRDIIMSAEVSTRQGATSGYAERDSFAGMKSSREESLFRGGLELAHGGLQSQRAGLQPSQSADVPRTDVQSAPKSVVNICLNYGGRQEIINAANRAIAAGKRVSEDEFSRLLYTSDLPDPDLLIRTGGEKRISNFMLFQLAYAELYFSDKLWPDFNESDFAAAIDDYQRRSRRFGGV